MHSGSRGRLQGCGVRWGLHTDSGRGNRLGPSLVREPEASPIPDSSAWDSEGPARPAPGGLRKPGSLRLQPIPPGCAADGSACGPERLAPLDDRQARPVAVSRDCCPALSATTQNSCPQWGAAVAHGHTSA